MSKKLKFVNLAISTLGEDLIFYSSDGDRMASTSNTHAIGNSNKMIFKSIALNKILTEQRVSYLKLDIEGYEYSLLESFDQSIYIPQIAIEFHHFCIPDRTIEETLKWVNKFKSWGYEVYDFGSWAGRSRKLPKYTSKESDLNVEFLFVKRII